MLDKLYQSTFKERWENVGKCSYVRTGTQKERCWFPNVDIVEKSLSTCFRPHAVEQFLDSSYMSKGYIPVFYIYRKKKYRLCFSRPTDTFSGYQKSMIRLQ